MSVFRLRTIGLAGAILFAGCGGEEPAPARPAGPGAPPARANAVPGPRFGPYPLSQFVIAHDAFLAGDDPKTVPAAGARFLRDDDEVFGLVVAERARAYAVGMLSYHHVVNDVMAGTPVAVTY